MGILIIYLFNFLLSPCAPILRTWPANADIVLSSSLVDKVLSMRLDAKPESYRGHGSATCVYSSSCANFSARPACWPALTCRFWSTAFLLLIGFIGGPLVFLPIAAIPILLGVGLSFCNTPPPADAPKLSYKQNMQKKPPRRWKLWAAWKPSKSCMAESRMQRLWESVVGLSAKSTSEARKIQ